MFAWTRPTCALHSCAATGAELRSVPTPLWLHNFLARVSRCGHFAASNGFAISGIQSLRVLDRERGLGQIHLVRCPPMVVSRDWPIVCARATLMGRLPEKLLLSKTAVHHHHRLSPSPLISIPRRNAVSSCAPGSESWSGRRRPVRPCPPAMTAFLCAAPRTRRSHCICKRINSRLTLAVLGRPPSLPPMPPATPPSVKSRAASSRSKTSRRSPRR